MEGFKSHMEGKGYSWMFDAEDAEDDDDRRPLMEELEIDPASVPFFSFFSFCHARCGSVWSVEVRGRRRCSYSVVRSSPAPPVVPPAVPPPSCGCCGHSETAQQDSLLPLASRASSSITNFGCVLMAALALRRA
jgi:hypothetical protein